MNSSKIEDICTPKTEALSTKMEELYTPKMEALSTNTEELYTPKTETLSTKMEELYTPKMEALSTKAEDLCTPKMVLGEYKLPDCNFNISDMVSRTNEPNEQITRSMKEKYEKDELYRNQLLEATRKSGTTFFADHNSAIQYKSDGSQINTGTNTQTYNYEKVLKMLKDIEGYYPFPQFTTAFGENSDMVKQIVEDTVNAVKIKNDSVIKKSLKVLKDLAIGAGGSLIASGILGLLVAL